MALVLALSAAASAASLPPRSAPTFALAGGILHKELPNDAAGRFFPASAAQGASPEDRRRMQRQYQEWQALPPEQKDALRRRMDELQRMPPQDRDRYQQRYRQWEQLPPDERRRIENDLKRWDRLSPQERDSIQKRFKP